MSHAKPDLYDSFALYASGVTLVTVRDGDHDAYLVAASVLTASVEPFSLAVSVSERREVLPAIEAGAPWAVSVLASHHELLSLRLAKRTHNGSAWDVLSAAGAERSPEGPLWLPDSLVTFWCSTRSLTPVHDQVLVVGDVQRGSKSNAAAPLLRWNHGFHTVDADMAESL